MAKVLVRTRPYWELPAPKELDKASPHGKLVQTITEHHVGLREIQFGVIVFDGGRKSDGTVMRFDLDTKPNMKPACPADQIARYIWLFCEQYVRRRGCKCQFRLVLVGTSENSSYRHEARVTLKPNKLEELKMTPAEDGDDGDDDGADPADANNNSSDAKPDPDGDDDDDDGEYEDDDDGEDDEPEEEGRTALTQRRSDLHPVDTSRPYPTSTARKPETVVIRDPPPEMNIQALMTLQASTLRLLKDATAPANEENRKLMAEMRSENSSLIRDVKGMAESVCNAILDNTKHNNDFMLNLLREQSSEIKELRGTVSDLTKMNHKVVENFQEIAQQGYIAFLDSMRMRREDADAFVERARDNERRTAEKLEFAMPSGSGEPKRSVMDELLKGAPIVLTGLGWLARRKGDQDTADQLDNLATLLARSRSRDEPDDEEGSEGDGDEFIDVDAVPQNGHAQANGNGHARAHGPGPTEPSSLPVDPPPFVARCRAFRAGLAQEQVAGLRTTLPKGAWAAFERACVAELDEVAVAAVQQLSTTLSSDMSALIRLSEHLREDQVAEILDVVGQVSPKKKTRPARPDRPGKTA